MPFSPRDLQKRGLVTSTSRRDQRDAPFGDLLYLVAESVAEAQAKLDRNTAEVLQTLAEADVEVPTRVAREVAEDGTVTTTTTSEPRSLLELGFTPTSYQFSEATIGLELDLTVTEETETEREEEGRGYGLRAGTYELTEERRYGRELQATASVEARLEPVPTPLELGPSESVGPAEVDETD
jgi:hypothetical protein